MQQIGYDELYGMDLDEYCKYHNTTIDKLIDKTKMDILLLKKRLEHLVYEKNALLEPITGSVYDLLRKKQKHLERLKEWKRNKSKKS